MLGGILLRSMCKGAHLSAAPPHTRQRDRERDSKHSSDTTEAIKSQVMKFLWVIYDFLKVIKFVDYTIGNALLTIITVLYDVEVTHVFCFFF